jgi:DNA-binding CsgD family transcriptional regulator
MSADGRVVVGRVVSPALVGREAELRRLVTAVTGSPSVVVVEGEAGIGKTRLVSELAARPELTGRRFVTGGCGRIREPFPLGPIVEALRGAGEQLAAARLSPVAGALRPLLPELGDLLPAALEQLDDRVAERHRVFRGLAALLTALGDVVLVVEDLHWADEQTVDFLGYLLGNPPAGLSVVLTLRGEEAGAAVRVVTERTAASVARDRIVLRPLDVGQTRELTETILETERISEELASTLCERASGVPLAIQELLALLRERGSLVRRGSRWARKAIAELDVPSGVRDSVLERVGRLSAGGRAAAEAAAVLQVAVPTSVLVGTCRLARSEALDGVAGALESGLLVESAETVGFRHALAAQAVYESIPLPRRQDLHGLAAAAVQALRPVPLGQVAHHLRHAEMVEDWVEAAVRAADQASELGDDTEAARLLEDVVRNAPLDAERRAELAVRLGWAALHALHVPDVTDLIGDVLDHDPPLRLRGQLRFLLGLHLEVAQADPQRWRQALRDAVDDLGAQPDLAAWAMIGLGEPSVPDVPPAEHMAWLERALRTLPEIGDPGMQVLVLGKVAMVFVMFGDSRWADLTERILAQTGGRPRHRREVNAYYSIALEACHGGHPEIPERLLTAALAGASAGDVAGEMAFRCRAALALFSYCHGMCDGLDEEIAILLDGLSDRPHDRIEVETVVAGLTLARGDLDAAHVCIRDVLHRARAVGAMDTLPYLAGGLLRLGVARGEAAMALAETAEAVMTWEAKQLWPLGVRALPALVEALVADDRLEHAAALVATYEEALRGLDAPLASAALPYARGHLAAAAGDVARAAEDFTAAAEAYELLRCPYEAAQAREHAAIRLFAAGNPAAADLLRAGIRAYEGLGARWDLDRAMQLARRHDVPTPARHRSGSRAYGSALSPREREVAGLAAAGLTNKEIARQLFLSPKTVDKHLSAVLRKLDLRSRTALARHMGNAP